MSTKAAFRLSVGAGIFRSNQSKRKMARPLSHLAPNAWTYLLIALFPVFGFLIPWSRRMPLLLQEAPPAVVFSHSRSKAPEPFFTGNAVGMLPVRMLPPKVVFVAWLIPSVVADVPLLLSVIVPARPEREDSALVPPVVRLHPLRLPCPHWRSGRQCPKAKAPQLHVRR